MTDLPAHIDADVAAHIDAIRSIISRVATRDADVIHDHEGNRT